MSLTSPAKGAILIGEDDSEVRGLLDLVARSMGYDAILAQDGEEVLGCLQRSDAIDAIVLDVVMPRKDGLETLREIRARSCSLPVIMVSDAPTATSIVQAMKLGATDFLPKPVTHDELRSAVQKAVAPLPPAPTAGKRESAGAPSRLFASSNPRMLEIEQMLKNIAPSDASVLIRGETGVGKEVVARQLHALSLRSRETFLKLNCAALPADLVESELFGYERGAFTGAFQKKPGMFELADGGTILLDEIGDMDFKLQAKLLQVLQDREFQRVGGKEMIHVDVRVMAATHQDIERAIANRQFREDLYYRLNVIAIDVPPLRERREDVLPMAEFLVRKHCSSSPPPLTPALRQVLIDYDWPGNIRELENVMRRFVILGGADAIAAELTAKLRSRRQERSPSEAFPEGSAGIPTFAQVTKVKQDAEATAILGALGATRWNRKRAATLLRIDYNALLYKMKRLGIAHGNTCLPNGSGGGLGVYVE